MNLFKSAILGCFLGILTVILIYILKIELSSFLLLKIQVGHMNKDEESSAEELASSIWCYKREDDSKLCHFKNLYYLPDFKGHLLFLINEFSTVSGVKDLRQLSLSTVQNHSGVYLKVVTIKSLDYLLNKSFSFVDTDTFIVNRFKSDNIMHVIHDDLLPLYITYKQLCSGNISRCLSTYNLLLFDIYDEGPYFDWYLLFSMKKTMVITNQNSPICMKRGVLGLANSSVWFQYGFKSTQGPVVNHHVNSFILREFSEFISKRFGLINEEVSFKDIDTITLISRKRNRKILNEGVLESKLKDITNTFQEINTTVINLDLSSNNSKSIIYSLQRSQVLVGMHGSAMILAIFMLPGSHIIELFPFGIQPEFVSPLRALCKLKNIYYRYESWVNMNESNTRTHPEYPPLLGGLTHLKYTEQEAIKNIKTVPSVECCHDPLYLFRMYQDTIVDESFFILYHTLISKYTRFSNHLFIEYKKELVLSKWYSQPPVFNLTCKCDGGSLIVKWNYPFMSEEIVFSLATSNGILALTKEVNFSVKIDECNMKKTHSLKQQVSVWVKTVIGQKESLDSFAQCLFTEKIGPPY